jgi:hypothetical protein
MIRRCERPAAFFATLAAARPLLYGWAVRWMLRRNLARLRAGDPEPLLATYADDVRFIFPGRSLWAANLQGKDEVDSWLGRFVRVGLRLEAREILVKGPPCPKPKFSDTLGPTAPGDRLGRVRLTLVPSARRRLARDARSMLGFHSRASREHGAITQRAAKKVERLLDARPVRSQHTVSNRACVRPIL